MKKYITYNVLGSKKKIVLPEYDPEMNFLQRYDCHMRSNLRWFMFCFVVISLILFVRIQAGYDRIQYKEAKLLLKEFEVSIGMAGYYFSIGEINEGQFRLAYCNHNWSFVIEKARMAHPNIIGSETHVEVKNHLERVNQLAVSLLDSLENVIKIPKPVIINVSKKEI